MYTFTIYNPNVQPDESQKKEVVDFLFEHLEEYGDPKADIQNCLHYAIGEQVGSPGGFVVLIKENQELLGVTIVNKTGMSKYIPENILVYIAVHENTRGKGVGKKLMEKALDLAEGDVALHVEPDNPAKFLYEKLGFTNKYLEMRYKK